ncbi:putative XRE regulator [Streptomyces sp. F-3]|nr:putative XRE regulator [Streptomyces sp. F-3]
MPEPTPLTYSRDAAPAWMRHHTLAVAIGSDLWAGPKRPAGLRKLAEFPGVTSWGGWRSGA